MDSNIPSMMTPLMWPEIPVNGNRQHYQQQFQFDAFHQPLWEREEVNHNFMTPENSLLSYDSSANSGFPCLLFVRGGWKLDFLYPEMKMNWHAILLLYYYYVY
ncbi:hypothetical protein V8G54_018610 [Vigna mungo]|uniref:Uncharacterized protein n=1 Tax=Vigna mungo TaxID=3915 RepID=A0AAQ3N8N7_VIGMU